MSLLPFLLVTAVGATVALLWRSQPRIAVGFGSIALLASVVAAAAIQPGDAWTVAGTTLTTTGATRTFLVLASVVALVLTIVGAAAGSRRDATAVSLAILGTSGVALAAQDARVAILAATAGGAVTALLALVPAGGRSGATVGLRVLRAMVVAGTMAFAAAAWLGRDLTDLSAQPVVFGLAYGAFALAVAIRFGVIPFHAWAARLTEAVPEAELPLVTAWSAAAFALVGIAWLHGAYLPQGVDPGAVRDLILLIAIGSIVLAAVAALVQDELEHIVGYSIVGDAGVVLLAMAALTPNADAPARTWILVFVVARSALAAWAAATRTTFFTGRIGDLRGWAVRSPLLGAVFGLVVVASIGIPGLAGFEARSELVDLALDGLLVPLVTLATFAPLLYYGRLLLVGLARPEPGSQPVSTWRPALTRPDVAALRPWLATAWRTNRALIATGMAGLLALLALAVMVGAVGAG
jgi:NADH:ubiquinone oxidoreductase subunit 2 (subunit N)